MDDCNCGKTALKDNNGFNNLQTPQNTQSNRKAAGALKSPEGIPAYPRINCAPAHVLDAEFGFTRKLAAAPRAVIARINRETKRISSVAAMKIS